MSLVLKVFNVFLQEHIMPFVSEWEAAQTLQVKKAVPPETYVQCAEARVIGSLEVAWSSVSWGQAGLLPVVVGARSGAFDLVPKDAPQDLDYFHELIFVDELARCGSGGVLWGLIEGLQIGLPPVLNFGTEEMKKRVAPDCLMGRKIISLNITEPSAGSDVAAIKTTAVREGDFYIVNGNKKWITNGVRLCSGIVSIV
ncbi:apdG, partial [Symbiodinium natans]